MNEIHRDNSDMPEIIGTANTIPNDSIDCGITAIKCCNTPGWQKLGTSKAFLIVLVLIGIVQGAIEMYFVICVRQIGVKYNVDQTLIDWLLVTSGIIQGILAIFVAYWGNRIHRISWISGVVLIQAFMTFLTIVPILTHHSTESSTISSTISLPLCTTVISDNIIQEKTYAVTTLGLVFVLQLGIALGNIVYMTLGISYLDDNIAEHQSPGMIGVALAAKYWGPQLGHGVAFGISASPFGWWLGWAILSPVLFFLGAIMALFPKRTVSSIVKDAAIEIVENVTSSQTSLGKFVADTEFWPSFRRMLSNKILMFNVFATVFIETAIINFYFHDQNYLQSRFFFPAVDDYYNDWTSRILYNFLKPPVVALAIIVAGLIVAKAYPSPRKLAAWNVITGILCVLFFVGYIFIDCNNGNIAGSYREKLTKPFCSSNCICPETIPFSPVCPEDSIQTYYSPCHAGCSAQMDINNVKLYTNCSCGVDTQLKILDGRATNGGCQYQDCQKFWILFQVLTIVAASLLGSGLIGNVLITIRSVLPQDKALALSMELWLIGLVVHIPGKLGYDVIANSFCQLRSSTTDKCYLHESPQFGNVINIVTASIIGIGVIFDIVVFILVKDLPLYGDPPEDAYRPIPMQIITNSNGQDQSQDRNNNHNNNDETDGSVVPYAVTPLLNTIQNTQENYAQRSQNHFVEERPDSINSSLPETSVETSPKNLNAYIYSQILKNNPDEDIPLNFNLQTTDSEISGPTNRNSYDPFRNRRNNAASSEQIPDTDSEPGISYDRLILPSQMKEIVKRQSTIEPHKDSKSNDQRALSPETDF